MFFMDEVVSDCVIGFLVYILTGYLLIFMINIKGAGDTLIRYEKINQKVAVRFASAVILLWPVCPIIFKLSSMFYRRYHATEMALPDSAFPNDTMGWGD